MSRAGPHFRPDTLFVLRVSDERFEPGRGGRQKAFRLVPNLLEENLSLPPISRLAPDEVQVDPSRHLSSSKPEFFEGRKAAFSPNRKSRNGGARSRTLTTTTTKQGAGHSISSAHVLLLDCGAAVCQAAV